MKRHIVYTLALICLSLAGCTAGDTAVSEMTASVAASETTSAVTADISVTETAMTTEIAADTKAQSFAQRAVGNYYCNVNGGLGEERLKVEIADFGGNLFAFCSLGGDTEKAPIEDGDYAYSIWTAEIIPIDAGAFISDTDRCEAGVVRFSAMSDLGRYWGPPDTGYISLTDDGISFEGIDLVYAADSSDATRTELTRYEGSSYDTDGEDTLQQELYGLWSCDYGDYTDYILFEKKPSGNTASRYNKNAGREAVFLRGNITSDGGALKLNFRVPGGEPYILDCQYSISGDTLSLSGDMERDYKRAEEKDIPLTVLTDADDINRDISVTDADGHERSVIRQFTMCTDVENNGGYFVRLGDMIFFRGYDEDILQKKFSYGGYLYDIPKEHGYPVCYYDTRTGETGIAFDDNGFGPLYYMNGMFYTTTGLYNYPEAEELSDDEKDIWSSHIRRCWPDGSRSENADGDAYMGPSFFTSSQYIMGVSDDCSCILVKEYRELEDYTQRNDGLRYSHDYYIFDGSSFLRDIDVGDHEMIENQAFRKGHMILVKSDYEKNEFIFAQYDTSDGSEKILGTAEYSGEAADYGVYICEQILFDGDDIYFATAGLLGDIGYPEDYAIYKAKLGTEDSLERVWQGMPDGYEYHIPVMNIEKGDIIFSEHADGWAGLSADPYGDLILCTPEPEVLIKGYETKNIYEQYGYSTEPGAEVRVLQTAEKIGGDVYIIDSQCIYEPDTEGGYMYDYSVQSIRYMKITADGEQTVITGT